MKIRGLPASVCGETLYSWSFRCAQRKYQCLDAAWLRVSQIYNSSDSRFEAPVREEDFHEFFLGWNIPEYIVWGVFNCQKLFLLDSDFRSCYCPHCLLSDVKEYGLPCWRMSWCDVRYVYCHEHKCLLSSLNSTWALQNKAWLAFSDAVNYGIPRGQFETPNATHINLLNQFNRLISRVQRAFMQVQSSGLRSASCEGRPDDELDLGCVYILVFSLLLRLRTTRVPAGVARYLLSDDCVTIAHGDFTYDECLRMGVARSNPNQRMVALLLLGWIVGLFNESEVKVISRVVEAARFVWPRSLKDLGRMAGDAVGGDSVIKVFEGKYRGPDAFGSNLILFVAGLKQSS
ncbi:hypothetical protein [Pseudomonas taiwanensis]|uniref:hypothetical protein n=1 Tax=Pseudomonas taiwanensis TaxID=470150 RepID=UPI0015B8894F|nr:hypothetical protein [Pseudomonas taiwanensis]